MKEGNGQYLIIFLDHKSKAFEEVRRGFENEDGVHKYCEFYLAENPGFDGYVFYEVTR